MQIKIFKITIPIPLPLQPIFSKIKSGWQTIFPTKRRFRLTVLALFSIWYLFFSLPKVLFDVPISVVLEDKNNELLGARIAKDGQWRFPTADTIPKKFKEALVEFEDKRFYYHPGIDPCGHWSSNRSKCSQSKHCQWRQHAFNASYPNVSPQ